MLDDDILDKAYGYVERQSPTAGAEELTGFNLKRTKKIVAVAEAIGNFCDLNDQDMRLLLLAAWLRDLCFSDTGELLDDSKILPVIEFLESCGLTKDEAGKIRRSIAATRFPQQPQDALEEALCDAVASFMASDDFLEQAERKYVEDPDSTSDQFAWMDRIKILLQKHDYFTKYARRAFSAGKEKNLKLLKKKRRELSRENAELEALWEENKELKQKLKKEKEEKVSKGIETMFRTTMSNHLQLSVIADGKANMMISVNAIIASVMMSSFFNGFQDVPHLRIPAILLTVVCMITVILSIQSTRPNIKKMAVPEGKTDFLFFGDFVKLNSDTYREGIRHIMRDHNLLYNSMADNIYLQGQVLARKYRLLKMAYTVFGVGFTLVLVSYVLAWLFYHS